ncbi:MAG: RnfABCDGE type electron transport complex subunit G [Candidatus Latescibacteria bacterium]|nr:RnfABCDGE type electron transport complex subunit G [Candidatus Latescibacterota bacterium]
MIYALIAGGSLAFVSIKTTPQIIENRIKSETESRAQVLPGMDGGYEQKTGENGFPYWIGYLDTERKEIGGFIYIAQGKGYSSTIKSMVGVSKDGAICGVHILSQQETPGLGSRIEEILYGENDPWFTRQFKGKTMHDILKVVKDGGDIDSITGATVSSRAVINSINSGLKQLSEIVGEEL